MPVLFLIVAAFRRFASQTWDAVAPLPSRDARNGLRTDSSPTPPCHTRQMAQPLPMVTTGVDLSLFWVVLAAVIAPLIARNTRTLLPEVVCLLGLGVVIGPSMLGLGSPDGLPMIRQLGLGLLFLAAGFEIDPAELQKRQLHRASITWLVSLAVGVALVLLVLHPGSWLSATAHGIAFSSTALGALVPILRDAELLDSKLGRAVLAHGTVGELGPVVAMALLLSGNGPWIGALVLIGFALLTVFLAWFTRKQQMFRVKRVAAMPRGEVERLQKWFDKTGQDKINAMILRLIMLLLVGLMALAALFHIDVALGAFMAGLCLRLVAGKDTKPLGTRIGVLANSFFVPVFFVISGMSIDLGQVGAHIWIAVGTLGAVLLTRGVPVWLAESFTATCSGLTRPVQRVQLALYASAGLPIIVAVTEVAVNQGLMARPLASCLVAGGALSMLVFPSAATLLGRRDGTHQIAANAAHLT